MQQVLILAVLLALAVAKPELYKEQEDFQYSRSSSDDGSKSGYYGAQRGNMGGNYERSHNMDSLAQNQMSGLVRQVEGELGDGANTRAGSVYTAANSKGTFGSGHFDLSNLAGRNFQEGTYYGSSQSSSSHSRSSSSHNSADYASSHSQSYRGSSGSNYRGYEREGQAQSRVDEPSADSLQGNSRYYNYGSGARHSSGFQSQAGFQEQDEIDHSNVNSHSGYGSNIRTRLISTTPVKVILTPGRRVAIPVGAQIYDVAQGSSAFDRHALNSAAAVVSDDDLQATVYKPSDSKQYQSSYSYHKKWEKHDTIPTSITAGIPTVGTIPINSELLEDSDSQSQYNARGSNSQSGVKSSSSQSRQQSYYNTQHSDSASSASNAFSQAGHSSGAHQGASSDSSVNNFAQRGYNIGSQDLNSLVENLNQKPKSYQSSYSYHKSWERQGDPYVIKPASSGYYDSEAGQRLTSSSRNQRYQSGYQTQYNQNHEDCDENSHIRIARSSYTDNQDMQQQFQNIYNGDELVQQVQSPWHNSGDLSQQSQNIWEQQNFGQETQSKSDNIEDFNQQSQGKFDNLDDFNQQSQSKLDNLEDFNQQSQSQEDNLEDLNQQSQSKVDNLEDFNQQSQSKRDDLEDFNQQSQSTLNNFEKNNQQSQTHLDTLNVEQQSQNKWNNLNEQSLNWNQQNVEQQSQNVWDKLGQQSQNWGQQNSDREWNKFEDITQQLQNTQNHKYAQNNPGIHQNDQQLEGSQTDTDFHKHFHNIQAPWNMIDSLESNTKNQQNTYFFPDSGNHQENKYFHSEQASSFGNSYHENVHYSYGNGFGNSMSNWNLNPIYQNAHRENEGDIDRLNNSDLHRNVESQKSWQEHTAESNSSQENKYQNNLHDPKILSFWNKFDNIEKELNHVINAHNISQSNSTYHSQINKELINGISSENQRIPQLETQSVSPKVYEEVTSDTDIHKLRNKTEDLETSLDIGRGDVGTDDLYRPDNSLPNINKSVAMLDSSNNTYKTTNFTSANESNVTETSTILDETSPLQIHQVNGIKPQNKFEYQHGELNQHGITLEENDTNRQERQEHLQNVVHDIQQYFENKGKEKNVRENFQQTSHGFGQESVQESVQNYVNNKHQNSGKFEQENVQQNIQNLQNEYIEQQNLQNFGQVNIPEFVQQNENVEQQNLQNFGQENIPEFVQQNVNVEQQNLHNFGQENIPEFVQQNVNVEQPNLQNFGQENIPEFVQQNVNVEQPNLQNFEQENIPQYVQQNENVEQQNLKNFEQENISEFVQQNKNVEQQNLQNFGQENIPEFVQQNVNVEQQNLQSFEQENIPQYVQQNENVEQQNLQKFAHENIPEFVQQNEKLEQNLKQENLDDFQQQNQELHNLHNFEQVNIQHFIQQNKKLEKQNSGNLDQQYVQDFEQQGRNLEQPNFEQINTKYFKEQTEKSEQKLNITENSPAQTVVEVASDKPGFWKSLGSKITNAKDKVVSWFKS